jgi:RNA polymerase sigma-70 factor (ECF subfamily)
MWLDPRAAGESTTVVAPSRVESAAGKKRNSPRDQALEKLYRDDARALRLYVKRLVRDSGDAEDIVQEAFIRLWRVLDDEAIKSPRAVLFTTARNLGLNHIRNMRVRKSDAAQAASAETFRQTQTTAEEKLIAMEDSKACGSLLDALPSRCREAFALRVVEELSYKEMANKMRLSVSTVEKHIGKAKQLFKVRIAATGVAGEYSTFRVTAGDSGSRLPAYAIAAE